MDRNLLSTHQIMMLLENDLQIEEGVDFKKQVEEIIPTSKAIGTLDLIKYITKRYKNIDSGKLIVYIDY